MISGYEFWKINRAVYCHFTAMNYDAIKENGRVRHTAIADYKKDKYTCSVFEYLSKRIYTVKEAIDYCIANVIYGDTKAIYDNQKSLERYQKYIRNKESLTQKVLDDLSTLEPYTVAELFDSNPPKLLLLKIQEQILPESIVLLNRYYGDDFVVKWLKRKFIGLHSQCVIIHKLGSFIKPTAYNETKIKEFLESEF